MSLEFKIIAAVIAFVGIIGGATYGLHKLYKTGEAAGTNACQVAHDKAIKAAQDAGRQAQQEADNKTIADLRAALDQEKLAASEHAQREQQLVTDNATLRRTLHERALKSKAAADWLPVVIPAELTDGLCWSASDCPAANRQGNADSVHPNPGG